MLVIRFLGIRFFGIRFFGLVHRVWVDYLMKGGFLRGGKGYHAW